MLFGIMAEDDSDIETLKILIKKVCSRFLMKNPSFKQKGYTGWATMFGKGVSQLNLFVGFRCEKVIVCFDADGAQEKALTRKEKIRKELIEKSQVTVPYCALVPIQEIEAWLLADLDAVSTVVNINQKAIPRPEQIPSPKEHLTKLCRHPVTGKERYVPTDHNKRVASAINVDVLDLKCPSFSELVRFVAGKKYKSSLKKTSKNKR